MIIKLINKTGFAQIPNTTLRDKRLSLDTRGFLGEILSYSTEFDADIESLKKLLNVGRKKLLRMTREMRRSGYLQIVTIQGWRGRIIDKEWRFYAESQAADFSQEYVRKVNSKTYDDPNQGNLFVLDNDFDQDAPHGYVGVKETVVEGHHHIDLNTDLNQKTDLKDLKINSLSQDENGREREFEKESESPLSDLPSQFSPTEILKYVDLLIKNGATIDNREAYAATIAKSNTSDAFILARLYPERLTEIKAEDWGEKVEFSEVPCVVCFGSKMEVVAGKGAKPCRHCTEYADGNGKPTGFEPLESFRQRNLEMLAEELNAGVDIGGYESFYSVSDWIWLKENLRSDDG